MYTLFLVTNLFLVVVFGSPMPDESVTQNKLTNSSLKVSIIPVKDENVESNFTPAKFTMRIENSGADSVDVHVRPSFRIISSGVDEKDIKLGDVFVAALADRSSRPIPCQIRSGEVIKVDIEMKNLEVMDSMSSINVWKPLLSVLTPGVYDIEASILIETDDANIDSPKSNRLKIEIRKS